MFIQTFFAIATIISSLFTSATAVPIIGRLATPDPLSLLGRHYRDVRVHHSLSADLSSRRFDVVDQAHVGDQHITRAERFHAIQRKFAEIGTRDEQLRDHTNNLLSNQYLGPPPPVQSPIPVSPPSPQSYPDMSVPHVRNPTTSTPRLRSKHLKGKKVKA